MLLRARRVVFVIVAALVLLFLQAAPAGAVLRPGPPPLGQTRGSNTQLTLTGTGPGESVNGFIANLDSTWDSATEPYPSSVPADFSSQDEGFAGVIYGTPTGGANNSISLFCINIRTDTYIGNGYVLGTWDEASVTNVGYVAQLLNKYPPSPSESDAMAAAVQAAIWYFSDNFLVDPANTSLHAAVASIVSAVQAAGPLPAPEAPSLTITPPTDSGPQTSLIGPYTVTSSATTTVTATGAEMFSDASGTTQIMNGATVPSGQKIWLKYTGDAEGVLQATADATVPSGNVYLYDGGPTLAQKLILAQETTLSTTVSATAEFQAPGSLTVTKTISGAAAADRGDITITVTCDGTVQTPLFKIAANQPAPYSQTYNNIPAGSVCTVVENPDGSTSTVEVDVQGNGQQVTIEPGQNSTAALTDTYTFITGSIEITKAITGPGAGLQGQVTISVSCTPAANTPDYVIPALTKPDAVQSTFYNDLVVGSSCTISEPDAGSNTQVTAGAPSATVDGTAVTLPARVTVVAATVIQVVVTNNYTLNSGSLTVDKTITGPLAGQQGPITITVTCESGANVETTLSPVIQIPAGTTDVSNATPPLPHTYTDIPAGSVCTPVESPDGTTSTVGVSRTGSGDAITIPPGGTVPAGLTDDYTTGLTIDKTIEGSGATFQGPVTISVSCTNVPATDTPDFVIPAGTAAGTLSKTYLNLPEGSTCTIDEPTAANGSIPGLVSVTTTGQVDGATVTLPAEITIPTDTTPSVSISIADDYTALGSLTVDKVISGPAAGQQAAIAISTVCNGGPLDPAVINIPAGATSGASATPPLPHTYTDIPANSKCTVWENPDGHNSTVSVTVTGRVQRNISITPGGTSSATITNNYSMRSGVLAVLKTVSGPSAGSQGTVTINVTCGGTALPAFTIAAGTAAGTVSHFYDGIPANSRCTVTETDDGHTSTVDVSVIGANQTVTIPAAKVVPVALTDIYSDSPGTLTVSKTVAGAAAGKQGPISVLADCGGPVNVFTLEIPAGAPGGPVVDDYENIPAGSVCTVTETALGGTDTVKVVGQGDGQKVTVPAGGAVTADLTDTFTAVTATTTVATTTTTTTTAAGALASTGAGRATGRLIGLGAAAIVSGTLIVAASARSRRRRKQYLRRKPRS
jgi:Domain of unknown function (DUF5979)/Thioester domain